MQHYAVCYTHLTGGWNTDCTRPIVVQVCQLVTECLHDVWLPTDVVVDNDVVTRRDGSLTDVLTHQEKVVPGISFVHYKF